MVSQKDSEKRINLRGCGEPIYSDNTPHAPSYSICRRGLLCKNCLRKIKNCKR